MNQGFETPRINRYNGKSVKHREDRLPSHSRIARLTLRMSNSAAVSAAALGFSVAAFSSLPPRARSRFVAEWDDGRGLAPAVGAGVRQAGCWV